MRSNTLLIIGAILTATVASADVYKCPDEKGRVVLQDAPCSGDKTSAVPERQQQKTSDSAWELINHTDRMTDKHLCIIESPRTIASYRGDWVFVTLRMMHSTEGTLVALYSKSTMSKTSEGKAFHNDIAGIGIRVDQHPFVPVDIRSGARVLGFLPAASHAILPQLLEGKEAKIRVRFWPYEETVDMKALNLSGLTQGLEDLKRCDAGTPRQP